MRMTGQCFSEIMFLGELARRLDAGNSLGTEEFERRGTSRNGICCQRFSAQAHTSRGIISMTTHASRDGAFSPARESDVPRIISRSAEKGK